MNKSVNEFNDAVSQLKKRGIVVVLHQIDYPSSLVFQYDWQTKQFNQKPKNEFLDLWSKIYLNSYGVTYAFVDIINALPKVTLSQLDEYHQYLKYASESFDIDKMEQSKKELLQKNENRKKEVVPRFWDLSKQIQYLINSDVFVDDRKFYQYDKASDKFRNLPVSKLLSVFKNETLDNLSASTMVQNHRYYLMYLSNANGLISEFNAYELNQRSRSNYALSYQKISDLIATFD